MRSIVVGITDGAVHHKYIKIRSQESFFPFDAFGGPTKDEPGRAITLHFIGTDETVETDISAKWSFRCRGEVGEFFRFNGIKGGDWVRIVCVGDREYRVEPVRT